MAASLPEIRSAACLNACLSEGNEAVCELCHDVCPAEAISLDARRIPQLDTSACTGCTACVRMCPVDAIGHDQLRPAELLMEVRNLLQQGRSEIDASCQAVTTPGSGPKIPCHAAWDPALLASMAAEGIRVLNLNGVDRCGDCPVRFGATLMQQTEKDYATLNTALGVRLRITRESRTHPVEAPASGRPAPEPERRAFFRNLIPALTKGAATATAQITQAASQALQERPEDSSISSLLPVRLRLFLRALPRLKANFTPIPPIPGLPMGSIQADDRCTACHQCVEQCPTQALGIKPFGANKVLELQPEACIGCSQCIGLCPEHALEKLPSISLPSVLSRRTRPLVLVPSAKTSAPARQEKG